MQRCRISLSKRFLDCLVAGVSCKPYSTARTGRSADVQNHPDCDLLNYFLLALKTGMARSGIFEHVWAFLLPDKGDPNGKKPIERFIEELKRQVPFMHFKVLIMGLVDVPLSKRRVYTIFVHEEDGGEDSLACAVRMLKVSLQYYKS